MLFKKMPLNLFRLVQQILFIKIQIIPFYKFPETHTNPVSSPVLAVVLGFLVKGEASQVDVLLILCQLLVLARHNEFGKGACGRAGGLQPDRRGREPRPQLPG